MNHREQMIERVVAVMLTPYIEEDRTPHDLDYELAKAILAAILPQVGTVEELEALPVGTTLLGSDGSAWDARWTRRYDGTGYLEFRYFVNFAGFEIRAEQLLNDIGPLTVVWRPS